LIAGITFAGGEKSLLFKHVSHLTAHLSDVSGLKQGAPVTMGGLTVGKVSSIAFADQKDGTLMAVTMDLRSDIRPRIKTDSVPSLRTQGMMGDRYIDISLGSHEALPLDEGGILRGAAVSQFDETLNQTAMVLKEVEKLLKAVNSQEGTVGKFFYDRRLYDNLTDTTGELNALIKDFKERPRRYVKLSIF
jgi:phospholipid/cholesterol/gamma-HCH transport system substrate-binding protein